MLQCSNMLSTFDFIVNPKAIASESTGQTHIAQGQGNQLLWAWRGLTPLALAVLHHRADVALLLIRHSSTLVASLLLVARPSSQKILITNFASHACLINAITCNAWLFCL